MVEIKKINNKTYLEVQRIINIINENYNIRLNRNQIHILFGHFKFKPYKFNKNDEYTKKNVRYVYYKLEDFDKIRSKGNILIILNSLKEYNRIVEHPYEWSDLDYIELPQTSYSLEDNYENNEEEYNNYLMNHMYQESRNIKKIIINEHAFNRLFENTFDEDVFVNTIKDDKRKKKKIAKLRYNKNNSSSNLNNLKKGDMLKTNKMDKDNADTYEIPLKGGIMSYNVTSIEGTEVMHYFKNYFEKQTKVTSMNIAGTDYELGFDKQSEFDEFLDTFIGKVNNVIAAAFKSRKLDIKQLNIDHISLFPVPSSSQFNVNMVSQIRIKNRNVYGLPVQTIDSSLLKKETSNLTIDDEFINKNLDYYNSQRYKQSKTQDTELKTTHYDGVKTDMNILQRYPEIKKQVEEINKYTSGSRDAKRGILLRQIDSIKRQISQGKEPTKKSLTKLRDYLFEYANAYYALRDISAYYKEGLGKIGHKQINTLVKSIKYSKKPSMVYRKETIMDILETYGKKYGLTKGLKNTKIPEICEWDFQNFQIKHLGNDSRMALKNYFQFNEDEKIVQQELEKIERSVLVIFDDNVSGGATLSDICYQLVQKGVDKKFIIPITFGKMAVSWGNSFDTINKTNFNME